MNQFLWHIINYENFGLQELPVNHTQCNKSSKINIEIQNTVPGMPVEAT